VKLFNTFILKVYRRIFLYRSIKRIIL